MWMVNMMTSILDKYSSKIRKRITAFWNKYLDHTVGQYWNHIRISKKNGYKHNKMVCDICLWFLENDIPFSTECVLLGGRVVDIVCPSHIKSLIEVRDSETEKRSFEKFRRTPIELQDQIIYVDAKQEFNEKLIL